MSTQSSNKINHLLQSQHQAAILLSTWLVSQGYSLELQKRYRKSGWFKAVGTGAMVRAGQEVTLNGAIHALQKQKQLPVHIGGKTALGLLGKAQYLPMQQEHVHLVGTPQAQLPRWFKQYPWQAGITYTQTTFLPPDLGLITVNQEGLTLTIAGAARALMECLYMAPQQQDLTEAFELMEGLNNLRPKVVQALLQQCTSVKVKRLFLFMVQKAGHAWFNYLDLSSIDLGHGKRSIVKDGLYNSQYQITVPASLVPTNE